jgi:FlaA1/EpsC-like NDP-sugar epimerase
MTFFNKISALLRNPAVARVVSRIVPFRFWIILVTHLALFSAAYLLAFSVVRGTMVEQDTAAFLLRTLAPLVLIRLGVFWYHDLYEGLWRYVSFEDLMNILRAATISSMIFILIGTFYVPCRVPESLYALDWVFCVMLVGGIRFSVREFRERYLPGSKAGSQDRVLVVGPVSKVHPLVKELLSDPFSRYAPRGIVDPTRKASSGLPRVFDLPVWSPEQALEAREWKAKPPAAIVLCWPEASKKQTDGIIEALQPLGAPFKTIPRIEDILSDRVRISEIRDVEIEDLLERPPIRIEMALIRGHLSGKTILVSGGGGSIGSELCRQIAAFEPALLVIAERSENSLFDLEMELRNAFPFLPLFATIASINDYRGMRRLMEKTGVDTVFHAAAYKHVPLMEGVPIESAYNNILGTYNLARAAVETGVKRFVMISTDKAVNPTNVMGVTKRIAEMAVQSRNGSTDTRFMVVRFGNVLGSAGSVAPLFRKQILAGGPLTITHPDIERFFMTIPEAVQLILQAGSMGRGGEIFVLEMGAPVKILRLAEKLISLSGKRPYLDVDIKFTGLRPGEKMYEELFNRGEEELPTAHPQIRVARSEPVDMRFMEEQLDHIRRLVAEREEAALIAKFKELVPQYRNGVSEVGGRKSEVGGRRSEVGGRRSEVKAR